MKFAFLITVAFLAVASAQEPAGPPPATPVTKDAAPTAAETPKETDKTPATELEARFKTTLTNATMTGLWNLIKEGQLTDPKPEKYTIVGVNKLFGERWLIRARIQYANKDITAPIPVKVKWAGDTPVITVDDFGLPGGNTYSARVLVYDDSYAGTWSGGTMRGLLSGMITREKEKESN